MSAISDDIETYESLCQRFGEKVEYSHGSADCYGDHAEGLKERARREWRDRERKALERPTIYERVLERTADD